jgi:hypothetical protein
VGQWLFWQEAYIQDIPCYISEGTDHVRIECDFCFRHVGRGLQIASVSAGCSNKGDVFESSRISIESEAVLWTVKCTSKAEWKCKVRLVVVMITTHSPYNAEARGTSGSSAQLPATLDRLLVNIILRGLEYNPNA